MWEKTTTKTHRHSEAKKECGTFEKLIKNDFECAAFAISNGIQSPPEINVPLNYFPLKFGIGGEGMENGWQSKGFEIRR